MKKLLGRALCAVVCGGILAIAGNAGPVIPVSAAEGKVCNVNDYKVRTKIPSDRVGFCR